MCVFGGTIAERLLVEWTSGGPEWTPPIPFCVCRRHVVPEVQVHFSLPVNHFDLYHDLA